MDDKLHGYLRHTLHINRHVQYKIFVCFTGYICRNISDKMERTNSYIGIDSISDMKRNIFFKISFIYF